MDIGRKTLEQRKRIPLPSLDGIGIETLERPQITPVPSRAEWDLQQNIVNNAPIPQRPELQGQQGLGQQLPPLEDENYVTPPTELSVQQDRYTDAVRSRPNKQGNLAQAAWWALQGINKIFNPQDDTPVQWLGEAKREKRIATEAARLAPLQAQEQFKQQQVGLQQKRQMDALEYQLKRSKGQQDAIKAYMDSLGINQKNEITPTDAALLNAQFGQRWTPEYWGKYIRDDREGVPMIAKEQGNPTSIVDSSRSVIRPETTVQVPLSGGGMGYVKSSDAAKNDSAERVAGITANRQIATTNANIADGVQQRNTKAINDYNNSVVAFSNTLAQKLAELGDTTGEGEVNRLLQQANEINAKYTVESDIDEAAKLKAEMDKVNEKLTVLYNKQSKNAALRPALQGMRPPVKPTLEKAVQVDMSSTGKPFAQPQGGSTNKTTLEAATQHFKSKGLSGSALRIALANARKMGMIE